jgi:hypothetical protein
MTGRMFVSHSFDSTGRDAASKLDRIFSTVPDVDTWAPTEQMRLGVNWIQQAGDYIQAADAVLLVMTPGSVREGTACREECVIAQAMGVPVIPLRAHRDITLYPRFVAPHVIWADLTGPDGADRLIVELRNLAAQGGRRTMPVPQSAWSPSRPGIQSPGMFVGHWRVTRTPKAVLRPTLAHRMILGADGRYSEHAMIDKQGRLGVTGSWGLNHDGKTLMFVADPGDQKNLDLDSLHGPNAFGGLQAGDRFIAERILELG